MGIDFDIVGGCWLNCWRVGVWGLFVFGWNWLLGGNLVCGLEGKLIWVLDGKFDWLFGGNLVWGIFGKFDWLNVFIFFCCWNGFGGVGCIFWVLFIVLWLLLNCGDVGVFVEVGFGGIIGDDDLILILSLMLMFLLFEFDDFEFEFELLVGLLLFLLLLLLIGLGWLNLLKLFFEFIFGCCILLNIGLKFVFGFMLFINFDCWLFINVGFIIFGFVVFGFWFWGVVFVVGVFGFCMLILMLMVFCLMVLLLLEFVELVFGWVFGFFFCFVKFLMVVICFDCWNFRSKVFVGFLYFNLYVWNFGELFIMLIYINMLNIM